MDMQRAQHTGRRCVPGVETLLHSQSLLEEWSWRRYPVISILQTRISDDRSNQSLPDQASGDLRDSSV